MAVAYRKFGGGSAEVATDLAGNAVGGITFTVWTADTGGSQVTDLLDSAGAPLPGTVTSQSEPDDPSDLGRVFFQAPDNYSVLHLDRGYGERWAIMAREIGTLTGTAIARADAAYDYMQEIRGLIEGGTGIFAPSLIRGASAARTFDVHAYGAAGDGQNGATATDDTAAFQAALDAQRAAGGGRVTLRPGATYLLKGYVQIYSGTVIEGWGARVIKYTTGNPSYAFFAGMSYGAKGYGSGPVGVRVSGLTFAGNFANGVGGCALALHHASDVVVDQCRFEQMVIGGHVLDLGGCDGVTVQNSVFAGAMTNDANAEAIQVDVSAYGSVSVLDTDGGYDALPTKNVWVRGNRFVPFTVGGTTYPAPHPLGAHTAWEGSWYENIHFTGNLVDSSATQVTDDRRGALHMLAVKGLRVTDNTFLGGLGQNARQVAVYARTQGFPASRDPNGASGSFATFATPMRPQDVVLRGNIYRGINQSEQVVYLDGCDRVIVEDILDGAGSGTNPAVHLTGCDRARVRVDATAPSGTHARGVYLDTGTTRSKVSDSIITGYTTAAAQATGLTNVIDRNITA